MEHQIEVLCNFTISGITPHNWIFFCQRCCRGQAPLSEAPPVGPLRCVSWRDNAICHGIKGGPGDQLPEKHIDEALYV